MRQYLCVGLICLTVYGCKRGDPQASDTPTIVTAVTARASKQNLASTLRVSGEFEAFQEVDLHAKVSGYIRRINVDIGDRVRSGQIIATLEVPELTAQVAGAHAESRHSQSEIVRANSEVAKAESSHAAVHEAFRRLIEASRQRPGLVAQQELDDAQAKDKDAEAQISVSKADVEAAQQQLGVSQADTQRVQSMSDYSVVTAPFNGVVTKRYADVGSLIQAGTASNTQSMPVVRIAQSDLLRLRMPVPETDVRFIKIGGDVQVHVQATERSFTAKIIRFTRSLDPSTRTMLAEVDVPNANLSLSPGMFADVTLMLQQDNDVITVPSIAVVAGDKPYCLVVDAGDMVDKRYVEIGIEGAERTEIRSGVSAGENVITSGQTKYRSGERVRPIDEGTR